jgi:hypothetical protein
MVPGLLLALALGTATPFPTLDGVEAALPNNDRLRRSLEKPTVRLGSNVAPPNDRKGHAELGKLLAPESHRRLCSFVDQ